MATPDAKAPAKSEEPVQRVVNISEHDAYIREKIAEQPSSLAAVEAELTRIDQEEGVTRLSLPIEVEAHSYDCTRGRACSVHKWKKEVLSVPGVATVVRWDYPHKGKYIFRQISKKKLALDTALNVKRWLLVNRSYFPSLPTSLFSLNGGIEEGDLILGFMPTDRALELRGAPAKRSQDLIGGRMTDVSKGDKHKVLMTGDPDNENVYMPELSPEDEGKDLST